MWAAMSCTAAPRMEEIMENQSLIHREANCLSRFDRLPVKSEMLKIIAVLAAVSVVEAFDLGLIGQTVLVLKQIWNLGPAETGLLATCSTIGVVLGTFSCGFLSDRYGRKRVLFWAVFIFTVFTFMGPLMENFYWVVAMRFLSGLGSGAVFPIPYLYISELVGAKQRGVTFAYCNSILVLSYVLPSSFGAWAVATFPLEVAWKLPFLVGGLPIVMLYFIHKYMPESPRWLMRHNRHDEAEALVERLESSLGMEHDKNYMDPAILTAVNEARSGNKPKVSWTMLFKPPYLSRTIVSYSMFSAALVFWYVVMVYAPTILTGKGFQMSSSVLMGGLMMAIGAVAGMVCGHMIEKYGRKPMYIILALLTAGCSILLTMVESLNAWLIVGTALAFFGNAIFSICKLYIAEQYHGTARYGRRSRRSREPHLRRRAGGLLHRLPHRLRQPARGVLVPGHLLPRLHGAPGHLGTGDHGQERGRHGQLQRQVEDRTTRTNNGPAGPGGTYHVVCLHLFRTGTAPSRYHRRQEQSLC